MRMQTIGLDGTSTAVSAPLSPAPSAASRPSKVTVAVLADTPPTWLSALADERVHLLCVDAGGALLLPQDRPDVLIIDSLLALSERRLSLLITQLRWGCPDMVVALADGMIGARHDFAHDLNFDPALGEGHVRAALAVAMATLARTRPALETGRKPRPALLRRPSVRRTRLFH